MGSFSESPDANPLERPVVVNDDGEVIAHYCIPVAAARGRRLR